ncbi:nuclear transport factor 2 family protein [Tsuneonella sp. SYSU-LHT278]|uniref:nuclear transport factor 2 family protein n=1 Tax=Tsuneonella sediminis TaxID=3416089 RepID=UPI003F7ADB2C
MRPVLLAPLFAVTALVAPEVPAGAEAGQPQHSTEELAVLQTNEAVLQAVRDKDAKAFSDLTVNDLRVLAPGGRLEDKAMVIKGLGTVVGNLDNVETEAMIVGDTALVMGKMQGDAAMEPFGKLPPMKYIATFVRTGEGWRMLSRAITPCASVAIEKGVC